MRVPLATVLGAIALAGLIGATGAVLPFGAPTALGAGPGRHLAPAAAFTPAAPTLSISSFSFNPSTIQSNSPTQVSIQLSGGTPPFYAWLNNTPPGCQQNPVPVVTSNYSNGFSCTPSATGTFSVHLDVLDSSSPAYKASRTATLTVSSGSGGNGSGGGGNGSFSLPSGLFATVTLLALVFLGTLVAIAAGTIATAVTLSRRLRQIKETLEKLQRPPEGPRSSS